MRVGGSVGVGVTVTLRVGARPVAVMVGEKEGEPLAVAVLAPACICGGEPEALGVPALRRLGETLGLGVALLW